MNDDEAKTLGMLWNAIPGTQWKPRMMNGNSRRWLEDNETYRMRPSDWPDFRDPPTMGWLLHQVREARGDPTVFADKQAGHWECEGAGGGHDWMTTGDNEAEALVNALEMAAKRLVSSTTAEQPLRNPTSA